MNIHQQNLLKLVKEIDEFCRRHDITYYCAGGTVIGAARHSGFIPWDDDIDIYMKRKDFLRFAEAFRNDPPPGRTFEYYEGNHEHQTMVARYHEEGTTMFCHYNMFGYSSAGAMIDVFVLDPIPDDYEARCRYLAGLYAYSDLVSPSLCYSHRLPLEHFDIYDEARRIMKEESREAAIRWVSDQIFCYEEEDCSCWCLRWGSVPLIYPMDVIGEPVYLPFEDTQVPVPQNWYEYLVVHYGANWMELPYVDNQRQHRNIVSYEASYEPVYEKRDALYSQDYLLDLHFRWKDAMRAQVKTERPMEEFAADLQNRICLAHIEKNLAKAGRSTLQELYEQKRWDEIVSIMEPYVSLQTHYTYMGELMRHGSQYHWMFPLIVPLPDEQLDILLQSLLRSGRIRPAEKLVDLHLRGNVKSVAVLRMKALMDRINEAAKIYYRGEPEQSLEKIERIEGHEEIPMLRDYRWLCRAAGDLTPEEQETLGTLAAAENASDGIRKAWGDCLWRSGRREEAAAVYRRLMETCRNGLFWNDIHERGVEIPAIPTEKPTEFRHTEITAKQTQLLNEVVDICEANGIEYELGAELSRRIFMTGNPGYQNGNRRVLMTADGAARFMEAFAREHKEERRLFSWEAGDELTDFALLYADSSSIYCDLRRLEQWRGLGVYVAIRILRREDAPEGYRKKIYYKEFLQNLISLEPLDMRKLKTGKKKAAYSVMKNLLTEGQKHSFRRRLFDASMKKEAGTSTGNYYYWRNSRGDRPKKMKVPGSVWRNKTTVEMDGRAYQAPVMAVQPHFPKEPRLSNQIPMFSVYLVRGDGMSWDEVDPMIDMDRYMSLDWEGMAKARKKTWDIEYSVRRSWRMIRKLADETYFREAPPQWTEEIRAALDAKDMETATELLWEVNDAVKAAARREIPFDLEEPLRSLYMRFLRETGQDEIADTIQELWGRDPSTFYNNA